MNLNIRSIQLKNIYELKRKQNKTQIEFKTNIEQNIHPEHPYSPTTPLRNATTDGHSRLLPSSICTYTNGEEPS